MSSKRKKYLVTLIIIIIFLFIMSLSIVLFLKNNRTIVNENDVILESDSNTIIIKSFLTTSDEYGKTIIDSSGYYEYLEFSIKNTATSKRDFQIYLSESNINTDIINGDYVKVYLTDYDDYPLLNKIPSFKSLLFISNKPGSRLLYGSTLSSEEVKKYKLRVWISDNYAINNPDEVFTFVVSTRAI